MVAVQESARGERAPHASAVNRSACLQVCAARELDATPLRSTLAAASSAVCTMGGGRRERDADSRPRGEARGRRAVAQVKVKAFTV